MFYIISFENEDVSIVDMHVSKQVLGHKLELIILEYFKKKDIEMKYDELFKESDTFYLVKNENESISVYQKTTIAGYIYNAVETREICVYYIKSEPSKTRKLDNIFTQQKSKLKKTVIIPEKKEEFNLMTELIKNPKFLKLRTFIKPDDTCSDTGEERFEINSE